ncbi:hypothetical protein [Aureliella helgolandensis]|uniref:hypothetical protein n=1 Tax=Aureliella helgolandensis TaxID=2527968 RepID=UPI0011A29E09|nr:hypothetical protein [Aureliella helgolandensis]
MNSSIARQVTTWLVLIALLLSVVPIPLARVQVLSGDSVPFPCQSCACGCVTAEQCWTSCCCYSPSERLQWAQENGVTPPAYAVITESPPQVESSTNSLATANGCSTGCCAAGSEKAVQSRETTRSETAVCPNCVTAACGTDAQPANTSSMAYTTGDCCNRATCGLQDESPVESTTVPEAADKVVVSWLALKCQGRSSEFTLLPWAVLESTTISLPPLPPWIDTLTVFDVCRATLFRAPDLPPPRVWNA